MRAYAFQGLRYSADTGDFQKLVSPLYDQIAADQISSYHQVGPHHFTHLTLPGDDGFDPQRAVTLHKEWREAGTVIRDEEPSLYPYTIDPADGSEARLGVLLLAGVEAPDAGIIRPHEHTLDKPLGERFQLLEDMEVDLEPIYLLADDDGSLEQEIQKDVASGEPVVDYLDADGHRHRLYRVASEQRIQVYKAILEPAPVAIADGHHRYKAARLHAEHVGAGPGDSAATKLAVIGSLGSPTLIIDPIHRGLRSCPRLDASCLGVASVSETQAANGDDFAAQVAAAPGPALGLYRHGEAPKILRLDPESVAAANPPCPYGGHDLTGSILHGVTLPAKGIPSSTTSDGTMTYRSAPQDLWSLVEKGELEVGFFLPPMQPKQFAHAIADGDVLPPKSTRFLPKVVSGLAWFGHDGEIL